MELNRIGVGRLLAASFLVIGLGCGDDGTEADRIGVAWVCADDVDCPEVEGRDGDPVQLRCLTNFKGGYCGLPDCSTTADCPQGAICVRHTDAQAYCFRECLDKIECNRNRPAEDEANCSSSFDFNDPADDSGQKACIPPSSGT